MIYQLVLVKNKPWANSATKQRSFETQKKLDRAMSDEANEKNGSKWVVWCNCAWANEEYSGFGIVTYKDIPARIAHTKELEQAGWYEIVDLFTLLGTDVDGNGPQPQPYPDPIYQLWMVRNDPVTSTNLARLTAEEKTALYTKMMEATQKAGGHFIIRCKSYWANEDFRSFGVTAFPNIEARQAYADELLKMNWPMYTSGPTILGVATQ